MLPRRLLDGAKPSAQIQQEVQDVVETILGAPVALDIPLMQVLPPPSHAPALQVPSILTVHIIQFLL